MKWTNIYATGVERLDEQHRMLFKMVEDFQAALDQGGGVRVYGGLLQSLALYARSHFRFEEECMDRYHCPVAQSNREAHVKFIQFLGEFQQRYSASGFDHADACTLMDTLNLWQADHVCLID